MFLNDVERNIQEWPSLGKMDQVTCVEYILRQIKVKEKCCKSKHVVVLLIMKRCFTCFCQDRKTVLKNKKYSLKGD